MPIGGQLKREDGKNRPKAGPTRPPSFPTEAYKIREGFEDSSRALDALCSPSDKASRIRSVAFRFRKFLITLAGHRLCRGCFSSTLSVPVFDRFAYLAADRLDKFEQLPP